MVLIIFLFKDPKQNNPTEEETKKKLIEKETNENIKKLNCSEKLKFYRSLFTKASVSLLLMRFLARFSIISIETILTPLTKEYYK